MAASFDEIPQLELTPIVLPRNLRGHVKYVAGLDEETGLTYSIGIRFVLPTAGAQHLLDRLRVQRYREYKKPVVGTLCPSMAHGTTCPEGVACVKIHALPEGYQSRRLRDRPVRKEAAELDGRASASRPPPSPQPLAACPPPRPTFSTTGGDLPPPCPRPVTVLPPAPALPPHRPPPCDFWGRPVGQSD
eukprot:EG_transcript_32940